MIEVAVSYTIVAIVAIAPVLVNLAGISPVFGANSSALIVGTIAAVASNGLQLLRLIRTER